MLMLLELRVELKTVIVQISVCSASGPKKIMHCNLALIFFLIPIP